MQFKQVDVDSLKAYPQNARTHNEKQVAQIAESIKEFGFLAPCLVDKDNVLIVGHGRLMAAKTLGMKKVPTLRIEHLTPDQVKAYRIADNQLSSNSEWDVESLALEIKELDDLEFDVALLGFNDDRLEMMLFENEEKATAEATAEYQDREINDVKMVQLFYSPNDEMVFRKAAELLQEKYRLSNISDVILRALKNETAEG
jgi:hypothetical protein